MRRKVSIIMGIYNCEDTICESIESIVNQTHDDWELIMCDDGSTDKTFELANKYCNLGNEKIKLLKNSSNKGLNYTLNRCLSVATGEYIARQDGDDISRPERLEKELDFLNNNSKYSFVSSGMDLFDKQGIWGEIINIKEPKLEDFLNGNPYCHAPVLIKRDVLKLVDGYSEGYFFNRVEDYHLWFKIHSIGFCGYNLPEKLYLMRDDENAAQRRSMRNRINESYIRILVLKETKASLFKWYKVLIPIMKGLLPTFIYTMLRKSKIKGSKRKRGM